MPSLGKTLNSVSSTRGAGEGRKKIAASREDGSRDGGICLSSSPLLEGQQDRLRVGWGREHNPLPAELKTGSGVWVRQGRQLQKDLESVSRERDELQEGLRKSNEDCAKQVSPASFQAPRVLWPPTAPHHPSHVFHRPSSLDAGTPGPGPELRAAASNSARNCEPGPRACAAADGECWAWSKRKGRDARGLRGHGNSGCQSPSSCSH